MKYFQALNLIILVTLCSSCSPIRPGQLDTVTPLITIGLFIIVGLIILGLTLGLRNQHLFDTPKDSKAGINTKPVYEFWLVVSAFIFQAVTQVVTWGYFIRMPGEALFALAIFYFGFFKTIQSKYRIFLILAGLALVLDALMHSGIIRSFNYIPYLTLIVKALAAVVLGFSAWTHHSRPAELDFETQQAETGATLHSEQHPAVPTQPLQQVVSPPISSKYCPSCGKPVPEGSAFCLHCGSHIPATLDYRATAISQQVAKQPLPEKIHITTKIICPDCGKDDMIQKVSAIYSGGVSTTSYQQPVSVQTDSGTIYGNVDKTAVSHTDLAKRLAPPPKPENPLTSDGTNYFGCAIIIVGLLIGFPFLLSNGPEGLLGIGIPIVLGVLFFKFFVNPREKKYKEEIYPAWDKINQKWSSLYYCYRNDCVFDPATGKSVPPERKRELIS